MSEGQPVWNAIKRGALWGTIIGLNLAFLVVMWRFSQPVETPYAPGGYYYPIQLSHIIDQTLTGIAAGFSFGAVTGAIIRWLRRPFSRMQSDLKAAAAMRAKELINEADFQSLKARILATYQPDAASMQSILTSAISWSVVGFTVAMSLLAARATYEPASSGGWIVLSMVLPITVGGMTIGGTLGFAIRMIQEKRGLPASHHQALGAGSFDPLSHIQTEAERLAVKR